MADNTLTATTEEVGAVFPDVRVPAGAITWEVVMLVATESEEETVMNEPVMGVARTEIETGLVITMLVRLEWAVATGVCVTVLTIFTLVSY